MPRSRRVLVDEARAGNEDARRAMLGEFASAARAGLPVDPDVLLYVAEQLDAMLSGTDRRHELGLPRRGRGRPAKLRELDVAGFDALLARPHELARYRLALAVARELASGAKLTFAREHVAQQQGVGVMAARRAWKLYGRAATLALTMDRNPATRVLRELDAKWGRDRVRARLSALGLLESADVWCRLAVWNLAGAPPESWAAPEPPSSSRPRRRSPRARCAK